MTAATNTVIPTVYQTHDIDYLFDGMNANYDNMHVAAFQMRHRVEMPDAIRLAMELPPGAFIAGGFAKSAFHGVTPKDYNIFFESEKSFKSLVRRIHNAPEGSFLHGYTSSKSLHNLIDGEDKYLMFKHPEKPPMQLVRVRWYPSGPAEAIDKFDLTVSQFALDYNLNMHFGQRSITDVRGKVMYLHVVPFPISTGLRLLRLKDEGYRWVNGNYDSYGYEDFMRRAQEFLRKKQKAALKSGGGDVRNVEGFGSFEP